MRSVPARRQTSHSSPRFFHPRKPGKARSRIGTGSVPPPPSSSVRRAGGRPCRVPGWSSSRAPGRRPAARRARSLPTCLTTPRKWSPRGRSRLKVSVRNGVVEVRDHGPGVDAEDAPLVFNRFYRSAAGACAPGRGTRACHRQADRRRARWFRERRERGRRRRGPAAAAFTESLDRFRAALERSENLKACSDAPHLPSP